MKINFICLNFSKVFLLTLCIILIISFFIIKTVNFEKRKQPTLSTKEVNEKIPNCIESSYTIYTTSDQSSTETKEQTRTMPEELKGFEIIGKIEIPKLNVEKYILDETSSKSLKASVTKLCGPIINEIGNFCIAGHNYNKVFAKIKKLEINDQIILTDIYGDSTIYHVYDKYTTSPKDVSCLNQDTQSEKELTLITCTAGAIKRMIVKAVEVYD